jgi:photosystem II stability/assembly factor-like uncharacterized protein
MSALAVSPTDANRYFAAAADGGVWRTTNGGETWTPLTDHMPTSAIGALALDPHDENVVYAGTGEANFANHSRYGLGLMRSTDGGDTWAFIDDGFFAGRTFSSLVIDPENPLRMYAAICPAGGFPAMAAAKLHPQRQGPLGVFRSDDGGFTWTHLTTGLPTAPCNSVVLDPGDSQVLYVGIGDIFGSPANGVYKSVDGGDSWQLLSAGLPADPTAIGRVTLGVAPTNSQRVYALIARSATNSGDAASTRGLYVSNDGGATWARNQALPNAQATYGWYLSVVAPHPTQPASVFIGGLALYRTTDDGATWDEVTPPHVDIHAVAWDAAARMLCGSDGGVRPRFPDRRRAGQRHQSPHDHRRLVERARRRRRLDPGQSKQPAAHLR